MGDEKVRPINPRSTKIGFINKAVPSEFDNSISYLEILYKLTDKINQVIDFVNSTIDQKIIEYIDERFNDIMIDAMYDAETETLILYLNHTGENE